MRKIRTTAFIICALTTASLLPVASFRAPSPSAQAATVAKRYTAKTEGFTALSNGDELYLYNAQRGDVWQTYRHPQAIVSLQFDGNDLYFLDETMKLYLLDAASFSNGDTARETDVVCSTFTMENGYLYYALSTKIYKAALSDLSSAEMVCDAQIAPAALSVSQETLYYQYGLNYLYDQSGREVTKLPENTTAITVEDGYLFGIHNQGGTLYGYDLAELTEAGRPELCTPVLSEAGDFSALSSHGGEVLLIKDGAPYAYEIAADTFAPAADEFTRPRADAIPENGVKSAMESENASFSIVQTTENALFIEVDLDKSEGTFHYLGDTRKPSLTALSLAVTDGYHLLFHRDDPKGGYKTYLVAANNVTPTAGETSYDAPKTGYPTATATLYKFPSTKYPTAHLLERGAKLTVLGEVQGLDVAYYKVTDGERTGYIPQDFFVLDGGAREPQTVVKAEPTKGKDAIWRLAYILLGGVAICVLVDFLILRKKRED